MKIFKKSRPGGSSVLTLRLWDFTGTSMLTLGIWILLIVFLSPLSYMVITSLKSSDEVRDRTAPLLPAQRLTYTYNGKSLEMYQVPTPDGKVHQWALVEAKRQSSKFIDPAHPEAGLIDWQEPYVLAAHRMQKLSLVQRIATDGWRTLVLRRRQLSEPQQEGDPSA